MTSPEMGPRAGGMAKHGGSAVQMIRGLGVTKQAASQLIDVLVLRWYLTREVNVEDRRRMTIELTDLVVPLPQQSAAGIEAVDAELAEMLRPPSWPACELGWQHWARSKSGQRMPSEHGPAGGSRAL